MTQVTGAATNEVAEHFSAVERPSELEGSDAQDWQQRVQNRVAECFQQASLHFGRVFPIPEVRFDLRGASAGQAVFIRQRRQEEAHLRFNAELLRDHPQTFLSQVVPHEVAHVIARAIHGRRIRPHGREWQAIMEQVMGVPPQVRHRMDVRHLVRPRARHRYACGCPQREHLLSSVRHNRIQRQQQGYICRSCRQPLSYSDPSSGL